MRKWFSFKAVKEVIVTQLHQGLTPRKCSCAIATGLLIGVFPILGLATVSCLIVAAIFGLNQPITHAVDVVVGPLKYMLIIPYLKFGEWLFGAEPMSVSLVQLTKDFATDPLETLKLHADSFMHVVVAWAVLAPIVFILAYWISLPMIRKMITMIERMKDKQEQQAEGITSEG